ncbi:MAG: N-acetylmuramoyl-L-alanine amidase, partial [Lewinella sp.]|nr:N-acetylmuramoyl-L-alanine amidase [Lewinella sp.]
PGTSGLATLPASPAAGPLDCPCPQPTFKDRLGWCPSGDCTEHPNPEMTEVTHLIVHHSAGANSASDWDAQVRLIWDFHVNGNGWDDIGYNWLIAPTGQLYQGRGDNIRGAHFCGHNSNTMGVCVMGNYTDIIPTAAALTTLEGLLSWKACDRDIDVLGEGYHPSSGFVVPYVAGHRDGCATACPGDSFYPLLPALREGIANRIVAGCVDLASPLILDWNPIDITSYELTWLYADTSATGFTLERGTDGTTFEPIADLPADARNFTETDFVLGNLYYYRIKAYNDDLQSGYSNTIDVNTFAVSTSSPALPAQTLRLAPNPVGETLQLQWQLTEQAPLLIILRDAQQRFVRQWRSAGTPPQTLELGHLPAGAYYLQVIQGPQQGVWPLIKR